MPALTVLQKRVRKLKILLRRRFFMRLKWEVDLEFQSTSGELLERQRSRNCSRRNSTLVVRLCNQDFSIIIINFIVNVRQHHNHRNRQYHHQSPAGREDHQRTLAAALLCCQRAIGGETSSWSSSSSSSTLSISSSLSPPPPLSWSPPHRLLNSSEGVGARRHSGVPPRPRVMSRRSSTRYWGNLFLDGFPYLFITQVRPELPTVFPAELEKHIKSAFKGDFYHCYWIHHHHHHLKSQSFCSSSFSSTSS